MKEHWSYIINEDSTLTITGYRGESLNIIVPEKIRGKRVADIDGLAFSSEAPHIHATTRISRQKIENIYIPAGIKFVPSIDDLPKNLKKITCPDSTIDALVSATSRSRLRPRFALRNLEEIQPVETHSNYAMDQGIIYDIEKSILYYLLPQSKSTNITISNSVRIICPNAFYGGSFNQICIPDSVVEIGNNALYACKAKKLVLGGGIPKPSTNIFGWSIISSMPCYMSFEEIEFREGITHLPQCFGKMKELKKVFLPRSLVFVPDKAFYYRPDIKTDFFDYLERGEASEMTLVVYRGSYAEQYALKYGYHIEYAD